MGATLLPPFQTSRGAGLVPRARACASRIGISPACVAPPAAAAKKPKRPGSLRNGKPPVKRTRSEGQQDSAPTAKKPKRPGSFSCGEPPAKRVRGEGDHDSAASAKIKIRPRTCADEDPRNSSGHGVAATFVTKNQASSTSQSPILQTASISELIAKACLAKATVDTSSRCDVERRRAEIQRRRAEARRELEQMVATADWNDPYINPSDVLK